MQQGTFLQRFLQNTGGEDLAVMLRFLEVS